MSSVPPYSGGPGGVGRRIEEAIELIELELRHAAAYVNDAVIPQVRTESISALRTVADSLRKFADQLDERTPKQPPQPPESPKS
jgi:predicted transcriptional regulator